MNVQTLGILFGVGLVLMFVMAQASLSGKMLCSFRRRDKTKIEKLIKRKGKYIIFEDGRYNIDPRRITLFWYTRGLHQFFPCWIPSMDFTFATPNAIDPETFETTWKTPEVANASQQEDSMKAFSKGIQSQTGTKSKYPEWLFPMIIIGLIALIGYWIYQMSGQIAAQGKMLNQLSAVIQELAKLK